MFKSASAQWELILTKPLKAQIKFLTKVCKVNKRDHLEIRGFFFDKLSFSLVRKIFGLVDDVIETEAIDYSFQDLIYDRLLYVSEIAHLYPDDVKGDENIIFGEGYHVYSASYDDLDRINNFVNSHDDIQSICDLGSGTGRAVLYMALMMDKEVEFLGLELVDNRVVFTNSIVERFDLKNIRFKTQDFLDHPESFEGFDAYYLFDPVGTDDVALMVSHFEDMILGGAKFYILFISGWDDLLHEALKKLDSLEVIDSFSSSKQEDRFVTFFKVI